MNTVEKILFDEAEEMTESDIRFLRDNPAYLELIIQRENTRLSSLVWMLGLAAVFVVVSKLIAYRYGEVLDQFVGEVVVDLVFEMGAALIGAFATVLFIEHQKNRQFRDNLELRLEVERRIAELNKAEAAEAGTS